MHAAHGGEPIFGAGVARKLAGLLEAPPSSTGSTSPFPQLTPRELAVLDLVAQGLDNRSISRSLFLSEKTVRNYVSMVLAKIHVATEPRRSSSPARPASEHAEREATERPDRRSVVADSTRSNSSPALTAAPRSRIWQLVEGSPDVRATRTFELCSRSRSRKTAPQPATSSGEDERDDDGGPSASARSVANLVRD